MLKLLLPALAGIGLFIGTSLGGTISGTVTDSAATTGVSSAIVQVRSGTGAGARVLGTDTTDASGAYSIIVADSTGNCSVRASLSGYNTKSVDTVNSTAPITINIAISKIITSTITGVISDSAAGTPLAGVVVRLGNSTRDTTGADGVYSFTGVRTGNQSIQATFAGYASKISQVSVTSADTVKENIALVKIAYVVVSGVVKDSAAGTAIAGVVVRLGNNRRDTTDATGAYSFDSVASGTYQIQASKTDFPTKTTSVTVASAAITADILMTSYSYVKVSGIVSDSATGTALVGAVVSLGTGGSARRDTTGADGAFAFDSVRSGNQSLAVTMASYNNKTVQVTVGSADVAANVALVGVVYGSVTGVVSDTATGLPITGAIVRIGNSTTQIDTTGADGAFSIANVRTGNQSVRASASKYTTKTAQVTVTANAIDTVNFALIPIKYGAVSGVVTDSVKATPLAGAIVRIGSGASALIDTTGADGAYSFPEVSVGSQTIQVSCANFTGKSARVTVSDTAATTSNFALVAIVYGSLSGVVTDSAKGTPVAGAIVRLGSGGGMGGLLDTTDAEGKYQFAQIAVGTQQLRVTATGFSTKTSNVTITETPVVQNVALTGRTEVNTQFYAKGHSEPQLLFTNGKLVISNVAGSAKLSIFSLNGKCVYKAVFNKDNTSLTIPSNILSSGLSLIAQITVEGKSWTQQILSAK